MALFVYSVVGLVIGGLMKARKSSFSVSELLLGALAAVMGGWFWGLLIEQGGLNTLEWSSVFVAAIGAALTLSILKLIRA